MAKDRECPDCGQPILVPRKRLCVDCANIRARERVSQRAEKLRKNYPPVPCAFCGEMTERFHEGDRFCSSYCRFKDKDSRRDPEERKKQNAKWRSWNFDYRRDYMLRYTYGIDQEKYEELLALQGGACAICGKTPEEEGRNLAVDHDHTTGEIFGILCHVCNKILVGRIRSAEIFARAANYLGKGTGLFVPPDKVKPKRYRRKRKNG